MGRKERSGWAYHGAGDFLNQHGQFWPLQPFPANERPGRPNSCFYNAFSACLKSDLRYVEGYALAIIPIHHAWCVDEHGLVIDHTWARFKPNRHSPYEDNGYGGIGLSYFGVEFPLELVRRVMLASQTPSVFYGGIEFMKQRFENTIAMINYPSKGGEANGKNETAERPANRTNRSRSSVKISRQESRASDSDLYDR